MAVAVNNAWQTITAGTSGSSGEPSGTVTISAGSDRMLVFGQIINQSGQLTISTLTVGGQAASYTRDYFVDNGTNDLQLQMHIWNEAAIAAMSGTTISYTDDDTYPAPAGWSFGGWENVKQEDPFTATVPVDEDNDLDGQTLNLTTTSTANDYIILLGVDSSANRAPLTADTLTRQQEYSVSNVAMAFFDGAGGDGTTTFSNDAVANSDIAAMSIVLVDVAASSGHNVPNSMGGMTMNMSGGMSG